MERIKKYRIQSVVLGLLAAFLLTRLYNINTIPIFTDEAIYVHWVKIFVGDKHQFFISLTDGKQPLFVWLGAAFMQVVRHDSLLAVRLVSAAAGLATLTGLYFLSKELLKDKRVAVVASVLYIIFPFALLYDKLALYDSLLATFAIWSLYLEVVLVRRRQLRTAIVGTLVIAGGLLTKSSAFFFLYLLPFSLLLFDFKSKPARKNFAKWLALAAGVVVGSQACYALLRFSPNYHYIADKNDVFIYTFSEWLHHPLAHVFHNAHTLMSAIIVYTTLPVLGLIAVSLFTNKQYIKEKLLIVVWFAVPFMALAVFGKETFVYPRYVFFMVVPLLVLAADALVFITKKVKVVYLLVPLIALLMAPMFYKDYVMLHNFAAASLPYTDRQQFIAGYASGYGVKETVAYLQQHNGGRQIYVGTEGTFGLMPQALQDYFGDSDRITIKGFWPLEKDLPPEVLAAAKVQPTYFVFYAECPVCGPGGTAPRSWPVQQIFQIRKPQNGSLYTLYKVNP